MCSMAAAAPCRLATPTALAPSVYEGHVALEQVRQPVEEYSSLAHTLPPATSSFLLPPGPKASLGTAEAAAPHNELVPVLHHASAAGANVAQTAGSSARMPSGRVPAIRSPFCTTCRPCCSATGPLAPWTMRDIALHIPRADTCLECTLVCANLTGAWSCMFPTGYLGGLMMLCENLLCIRCLS